MPKQPDRYTCNSCGEEDLPTEDVVTRTDINEKPNEEPLFIKATLCFPCDQRLGTSMSEFGFESVSKATALGEHTPSTASV